MIGNKMSNHIKQNDQLQSFGLKSESNIILIISLIKRFYFRLSIKHIKRLKIEFSNMR